MDPPACIQNAMMTKDKKPFTYTPGGIDLSEVRSPRMARRIERNANLGGVEDVPRPQQTQPTNYASLPPSTLAAMRPQPQVQVFPSGPPPPAPIKGGMPPPPPPPINMPPPPPPPSCPLPTQKVKTADQQTLERPDMTKIIPENPMALLRKTGGPSPRKSLVDEMFEQVGQATPTPKSPPSSPPYAQDQQNRYQLPANDRGVQIPPVPQQQNQVPNRPQVQQSQRNQTQYQPPPPSQPIHRPPQPQYSPEIEREETRYQPPIIERKPVQQRPNNEANDTKTSTAQLGQLYIPPTNQQQRRIVSPPSPPERNTNSPQLQTPPLKEAPRPWQTKKPQQEELPPWTRKETEVEAADNQKNYQTRSPPSQLQQNQQPRWPQSKPAQSSPISQQTQSQPKPQYQQQPQQFPPQTQFQPVQKQQQSNYSPQPTFNNQQPIGMRIEIRTKPYNDSEPEDRKPNAVFVTQPIVLQHPGPNQQQRQFVDNQGARVIQVEGSDPRSPPTPKSLTRQQSWGSNPTQSNSFKIIQKITQTDDNDDEDTPVTQHSPRYPQNFQQPTEQMRRMKIQENEQNRFRQGSGGPQSETRQPHVRTIPIQLEDDGPSPKYVHPSEQVVPEPKKYTGSAIPSRSFKMLQAMTAAPDNCANVDEQYEAPIYEQWAYPPYPYPPYWPEYYHSYYYPEPKEDFTDDSDQSTKRKKVPTPRATPVPFWEQMPPYYPPKMKKVPSEENYESSTSSRSTPLPFWNPEYYYPQETPDKEEEHNYYPYYPPYYDPYYYHYYYGYPPMYPPPYYYGSGNEDFNGYSSAEEFNSSTRNYSGNLNKHDNRKSNITAPLDIREKVQLTSNSTEKKFNAEHSQTDKRENIIPIIRLPSLKSVSDMKIYEVEDDLDPEDQTEECSDYTTEDTDEETSVYAEEEDEYPHQLSVILEESERTESRLRSVSVMSDTSTLSGKTGVEEEEPQLATIALPPRSRSISKERSDTCYQNSSQIEEITASFTLKSPSSTPRISEERTHNETNGKSEEICNKEEKENVQNIVESIRNETIETTNLESANAKEVEEEDGKESDESEDWWGILGKDDDDLPKPKKQNVSNKLNILENNKAEEQVEESSSKTDETIIDNQISNTQELQAETQKVFRRNRVCNLENDLQLDSPEENKRRSVYDLEDEEEDDEEIINTGKIVEMESFVEQLEQLKRNSGLWNLAKVNSRPKIYTEKDNAEKVNLESGNETKSTDSDSFIWTTENHVETKVKTETKTSSADYKQYNYSESSQIVSVEKDEDSVTDTDDSDSETSSSDDEQPQNIYKAKSSNDNPEEEVKLLTIKERIAALKDSIKQKQNKMSQEDSKISVKEKISAIETGNQSRSKTTSNKSSVKSFEEYSEEEEADSGVTSDMSRHISDNEEFPELKKLTRYQRAATHSRLFKLLQEECDNDDEDEEDEEIKSQTEPFRRDLLNLPLNKFCESDSSFSSGKSSPNGGVNEKLVNELVQSLLKRKKGQAFKKMPREKLYAAAAKVLQEEMDILETPSDYSSFLSPLRNSTGYSTAAQTPQEFNSIYDEYKQYYESWSEAEKDNNFKNSLLTKGSKSLSSKHIHKKIMKLLDSSESSPPPNKPLDSNEVTTAS